VKPSRAIGDVGRIIETMNSMVWYHRIELAPGIVTPGADWESLWAPMRERHRAVDFRGKRVLEVGCWDGYWSFEAEKLGAAEIWATDDMSQRKTVTRSVPFVIECLGSKVRYRDDVSVYDVDALLPQKFDVVICYGVLYHLRYPVLGLAKMRKVLKTGGTLLIETAVLLDTEETTMTWGHDRIYPGDPSTWNAPSLSCLRFLLESSYFEVRSCETFLRQDEALKIGRAYARATAVERSLGDRHVVPDHFLAEHDTAFGKR
jgi:SAM-dependent methyltransferase